MSALVKSKLTIRKIDPTTIQWRRHGHHKYEELFSNLDDIQVGECLEVVLPAPHRNFPSTIYYRLHKTSVSYGAVLRRLDETRMRWAVMKINRKD